MKILTKVFLLLTTLLFFNRCAQLSSLQNGKTLEKNEKIIGSAVYAYGLKGQEINNALGSFVTPHLEVFGRCGLANKFDAGLKLSSGGNILLDGKLQIIGNQESKFAFALGSGFEYQYAKGNETSIFRTNIPLYFSYHPNQEFAIYATPKYVFQFIGDDDNSNFFGSSFGVQKRLNNKFTGILEGNVFKVYNQNFASTNENVFQIGLGFLFHLE